MRALYFVIILSITVFTFWSCSLLESNVTKDPILGVEFFFCSFTNATTNYLGVEIVEFGYRFNNTKSEMFDFEKRSLIFPGGDFYPPISIVSRPVSEYWVTNERGEVFDEAMFSAYLVITVSNDNGIIGKWVISGFPENITNVGDGIYGVCYNKSKKGMRAYENVVIYSDLFPGKIFEVLDYFPVTAFNLGIELEVSLKYEGLEVRVYGYEDNSSSGPRITNTFITNFTFNTN